MNSSRRARKTKDFSAVEITNLDDDFEETTLDDGDVHVKKSNDKKVTPRDNKNNDIFSKKFGMDSMFNKEYRDPLRQPLATNGFSSVTQININQERSKSPAGINGNTARSEVTAPPSGVNRNTARSEMTAPPSGVNRNTARSEMTAPTSGVHRNTARSEVTAPTSGVNRNTARSEVTAPSSGINGSTARSEVTVPKFNSSPSTSSPSTPKTQIGTTHDTKNTKVIRPDPLRTRGPPPTSNLGYRNNVVSMGNSQTTKRRVDKTQKGFSHEERDLFIDDIEDF